MEAAGEPGMDVADPTILIKTQRKEKMKIK